MLLGYQGAIIAALLGLGLAAYFANRILSIEVTDSKVQSLSDAIRKGSMAFLKRQYSWVSIFVAILAVLISTLTEWGYPWGSIAFVGGALFSSLAGFIGMRIATAANGRTTEAARDGGTLKALPVAFRGGAVMGFSVAGLGLLGVALGYWIFIDILDFIKFRFAAHKSSFIPKYQERAKLKIQHAKFKIFTFKIKHFEHNLSTVKILSNKSSRFNEC